MNVDHIFIFAEDKGQIADQLVGFGLTEGSSRTHTGQGTANRKFYFRNFFLEALWVHNEDEINSELIKETGLWHRANFRNTHFSRFGLCLINTDETERLFENAFKYQPTYFPEGLTIDVLRNEGSPALPWAFRLPFKGQKKNETEPTDHPSGMSSLTRSIFECEGTISKDFLGYFESESGLEFKTSSRTWLTLIFDNEVQGHSFDFENLSLTFRY
ncbi:VOC family protein [Spirosoma arcticum]